MSKRNKHHEEHIDETWLIPYSDMLTLLLALFIVMFSMSQIDKEKYEQVKEQFNLIFAGGSNIMENDGNSILPLQPVATQASNGKSDEKKEDDKMKEIKELLEKTVSKEGYSNKIAFVLDEEGLDISIQDSVLFESGDANIMQNVSPVLTSIAKSLSDIDNNIRVLGHTDNIPIKNDKYRSNWDLSAMRAINVMQFLVDSGNLQQNRFTVQGNGEFSPKYDNSTAEGRAKNRRVEIIVVRKYPLNSDADKEKQ